MKSQPLLTAPIAYRIEARDLHAHLFDITLTIAEPQAQQRGYCRIRPRARRSR